jgi:hypothetical protein
MHHVLASSYPVPSGWRAVCTCGHTSRGVTQAGMFDAFVRHAEGHRGPALGRDHGDEDV